MRQRSCAALLLCGPLVAGCGTATRIDLSGRSRPAAPVNVSVWSGPHAVRLTPSHVRPGFVLFNITNQSGRTERFSVRAADGRVVTRTPPIGTGQTAQLKANLRGFAAGVTAIGRAGASFTTLDISGRPRTGNDEVAQP